MRRIAMWLLVAGGLTLSISAQAQADTFVVTELNDPPPTVCLSGLNCTLREAVTRRTTRQAPTRSSSRPAPSR
jgi:hypothetical protein